MKIYIIGAGAVGGYFGARLAQANIDITFVARGSHFEALKKDGISIESVDGDFSISKINVIEKITNIKDPDVIIVATKTYDNPEVAKELTKVVNRETVVVTLQNGVANDFELMKQIKNCAVYPGLVYILSSIDSPGKIKHIGGMKKIIFGARDNSQPEKLGKLEEIFKKADVNAVLSDDIERDVWKKYIFIIASSGMTGICRSTMGKVIGFNKTLAIYEASVREVIELATLIGINLPVTIFEDVMQISVKTNGASKSSLLKDIEAGRKTEIETLNGTLVHLARNNNLDLPVNEMIYSVISLLDQ